MQDALIGTGFPYRSQDLQDNFFACAREVLNNSRGIRRMGSAALDLSYVAAGYLQGFWETDLQPYDVAAALLFMKESGCLVTDERGKDYDMFSPPNTGVWISVGASAVVGDCRKALSKHDEKTPEFLAQEAWARGMLHR